jgi:hypothetical protein
MQQTGDTGVKFPVSLGRDRKTFVLKSVGWTEEEGNYSCMNIQGSIKRKRGSAAGRSPDFREAQWEWKSIHMIRGGAHA